MTSLRELERLEKLIQRTLVNINSVLAGVLEPLQIVIKEEKAEKAKFNKIKKKNGGTVWPNKKVFKK